MIEIQNLYKSYPGPAGPVEVLKGIDLTVPAGSVTAVVGPSGAGKSTLSHCISLLERPTSGSVRLDGKDLSGLSGRRLREERRAIGTIFQHSALLRRMTVAQNVALPLEYLGVSLTEMEDRVAHLLRRVGILDRANNYPGQLSGGQRQRVGIARALALRPRILLSDESTSGLDPRSTSQILDLLRGLRDELGLAIILITHEMDVVRNVADRVAFLSEGRIAEQGTVQQIAADLGSDLRRRLVPVSALPLPAGYDYRLDAAYQPGSVDPQWLGRLGAELGARVALLGSTVETHYGTTLGRAVIGVGGSPLDSVVDHLRRHGLHAVRVPDGEINAVDQTPVVGTRGGAPTVATPEPVDVREKEPVR